MSVRRSQRQTKSLRKNVIESDNDDESFTEKPKRSTRTQPVEYDDDDEESYTNNKSKKLQKSKKLGKKQSKTSVSANQNNSETKTKNKLKRKRKSNKIYSSDDEQDDDQMQTEQNQDDEDDDEDYPAKYNSKKKQLDRGSDDDFYENGQNDEQSQKKSSRGPGRKRNSAYQKQRIQEQQQIDEFLKSDDSQADYMDEEILGSQDADFFNFETDYNQENCYICKEQGTLICCENCNKSFHMNCIGLSKVPSGMWECVYCSEEQKYQCNYCDTEVNKKDTALQCSMCNTQVHINCINIPLQFIADCPMNRQNIIPHEIQKKLDLLKTHDSQENHDNFENSLNEYLDEKKGEKQLFYICNLCMQYSGCEKIMDQGEYEYEADLAEEVTDNEAENEQNEIKNENDQEEKEMEIEEKKPQKKTKTIYKKQMVSSTAYLVKLDHASFLNTFWISTEQVEKIAPRKIKNFKDKLRKRGGLKEGQDEDMVEELDDYTIIERVIECKRPLKFCNISYKEIMERMINEDDEVNEEYENCLEYFGKHNMKFLVKWKSLPYDKATWEDEYIIYKNRNLLKRFLIVKYLEELVPEPTKYKEVLAKHKEIKHNKFADKMKKQQPNYITGGCLHGFQIYGIKWISDSYDNKNNVILADEMGLGKTIQSVSFLNFLYFQKNLDGPFIVVVPATTMYNWYKELEQWGDKMNAIVYMGNPEAREAIRKTEFYYKLKDKNNKQKIAKFNVMITSYETAINDIAYLKKFHWETMIIDEAHRLKNNESKFFKMASTIKTKHKLLLTGTPLQNNIMELLNLIEFICPQKAKSIKSYETLKYFFTNQQPSKDNEDQISEEDKKVALQELTEVLKPHLLRRKKEDVDISLPEMEEIIVKIALTDSQKYYYKNVLVRNYENLKILDTKSKSIGKISLLNILMNLRLICNHPFLFLYKKKYDLPEKSVFEDEFINISNKLKFLSRVIPKLLAGNHKLLIFSQFVMMLDILGDYFNNKQYPFERLDGQTSVQERQKIIDSFNDENSKSKIFLLSTRAGGLGINLTSADTIFFVDSDFNPYRDVQAISRAHRMGQQNRVKVYRLVSKYSAEERIIEIATKKLLLESIIINPINKFTKDDFESILQTGSYEMFNKNLEQKDEEFTEEQIDVLLQRNKGETQEQKLENVQLKKNDLNDYYLSGFKFTSLNFETVNDQKQDENKSQADMKQKYWETLLDEQANELRNAQNEMLGKGKRVRKTLQQTNYDEDKLSRSNSLESDYSDDPDKKDSSNSNDMKDLVQEKQQGQKQVLDTLTQINNQQSKEPKKTKKQLQQEKRQQLQEMREKERLEKEQQRNLQRQKQQTSKNLKITNKLMNFFEEEVFAHSQVKYASTNNKDRLRYVIHNFDEDHRIQFLSFVCEYGTEYSSLQEFFDDLCSKRPEYFNSNDKQIPSFNDFRIYLKEFYSALLFHNKLHKSNAVFCQQDPSLILRRISSINFLSKKYQYFCSKPDRFRISHKDYLKNQIKSNENGTIIEGDNVWNNYDDFLLCKSIFKHGFGNWQQILEDSNIWLTKLDPKPVQQIVNDKEITNQIILDEEDSKDNNQNIQKKQEENKEKTNDQKDTNTDDNKKLQENGEQMQLEQQQKQEENKETKITETVNLEQQKSMEVEENQSNGVQQKQQEENVNKNQNETVEKQTNDQIQIENEQQEQQEIKINGEQITQQKQSNEKQEITEQNEQINEQSKQQEQQNEEMQQQQQLQKLNDQSDQQQKIDEEKIIDIKEYKDKSIQNKQNNQEDNNQEQNGMEIEDKKQSQNHNDGEHNQQNNTLNQEIQKEDIWKRLFNKFDNKNQDKRDLNQIDKQKAIEWIKIRLRNRASNMINWLLELDEAKQDD